MLEKITSFITGIMVAIGGFFTPTPVQDAPIEPAPIQEEAFGAFSPVAGGTYRLKTSIGTSDTTIILSAFTEPITGNPLTMTSLASDIGYATLDPQSSTRKEFISFTGITQNGDGSATLTGVSRGLGFQSPFTASSTLRKSHPGQSIFILSDSPQLFNEYAIKRNNETITGQWTFTTFPITPSTTPATATTSGQVELATGGEAASSTLTGDVGRLALGTDISTSSAPASGNVVVVTGDDGNIDSGFLGSDSGTNRIVFDSNGTYTKSTRTKYVFVEVWAGGGSGGARTDAEETGGGGGGGYVSGFIASSSLSATTSVLIGNGGVAVSGNANGNAGASSTFSTLVAWGGNYGCSGGTGAAGGAGGGASATSTVCSSATQGNAVDIFGGTGGGGGGSHGSSTYGGGGGGGSLNSSFVGGGGRGVFGGGGGGGCAGGVAGIAGTSQFGGAGGVGCGGNGSTPGGGGGGSNSGSLSGAGGKGRIIITEYF